MNNGLVKVKDGCSSKTLEGDNTKLKCRWKHLFSVQSNMAPCCLKLDKAFWTVAWGSKKEFQVQFRSVQSLSRVRLFATPWTAARHASLSIINSQSPPKPMSIESVMPYNHLILCRPLLVPSIFPRIRVFSNESALRIRWPKYWSFSFNISPSNEHPGLNSFMVDLLTVQGTLKSLLQHHSSKASVLQHSAFFTVQLSHPYMNTGKPVALTRWTFVGKKFSTVYCDPHSQRLWHSQESRSRCFLELSCFVDDPMDVGNLISGSFAFSKISLNIWKFMVHVLLKPGLENFEHYFTSVWDECTCAVVWAFFGIAFLWDWNENTFSSPVATAEFSKFAGILSAALSQHHLSGFEIAQLEFHHLH